MLESGFKKNSYKVLGLMSGTSLDGLDLVLCQFSLIQRKWKYKILGAKTIAYSLKWKDKLKEAYYLSKDELANLDIEYGKYLAELVNNFHQNHSGIDFIASHGHTVFHKPEQGITVQIGNGNEIAKNCSIPVIYDFRTNDVSLGGQGAPLVPIGDRELFGQYDACLNLGGFSNISFEKDNQRKAFDICPVNIVLNRYALKSGFDFDKNGELGRKGKIQVPLLEELNSLPYYQIKGPSSLGYEWLEEEFLPILDNNSGRNTDVLGTLYEHISIQIAKVLNTNKLNSILVTGGGAFNLLLIEKIKNQSNANIVIPTEILINFKEALIFAFLGILKLRNEINCLASVTGARKDNIGGKIAQIK